MAKLHHSHAGLLLVRNKRQVMIPLTKDLTTIGRKSADIILDDPKVSSAHCEVRREGNKFYLIDLKSTNGCYVNRKQVSRMELVDQDVLEVGSTTLCYFEDIRDFHGTAEETTAGMRLKSEPETESTAAGDGLTTTKTLHQLEVGLEILEGPNKGKKYKFKKPHITIGRNDADLVLLDLDTSRAHAMLEVLGTHSVFLRDMGSTNGTLIKGKKVQSEKISSGVEFTVGNTTIRVTFESGEAKRG